MTNIVLFDPGDSAILTFDWEDMLPSAVTLVSVTHTVPSPLTKVSESTDGAEATSAVKISGAVHGGRYMVEGQATLSNGEVLNRQFEIKGWNS